MSQPLISCIIPVFNGERYLAEAIRSVLRQSYAPLELIIVDDGSSDGSPRVAASLGQAVRYIRQANAGPAAARNRGLEQARGEFVGFLDHDDLWHPDKLALQMAAFEAQPESGYCICHAQNFWVTDLREERELFSDHARSRPLPAYVTSSLLAARRVFEQVGGFDADLRHADAADWFIRARAAGVGEKLLPDVLLYRRLHPSNLSRSQASQSRGEFFKILKARLSAARTAGSETRE